MTDPLDALRAPLDPVDPEANFALRLRVRVMGLLTEPRGTPMTAAIDTTEPTTRLDTSAGPSALVPYLSVRDARAALDFYRRAFGGRPLGEPIVMDDGRIGHAEMEINGARLMLADGFPEIGLSGPRPDAPTSVSLHLAVDDVDETVADAVAEGATLAREPADSPYGRSATVIDPFGHRWLLMRETAPGTATPDGLIRTGDVGYVSWWVPDASRAATFFGSVLGWTYDEEAAGRSRQVRETSMHHGIWAAEGPNTLFLAYAVDDVTAAAQRVRTAGGTAGEPDSTPHGIVVDCVDDQGLDFALFEPLAGEPVPRPAINGEHHGDVSYLTMYTPDSVRTREFYGAVLGWTFEGGRMEDGWEPVGVHPMFGIGGGHDGPPVVLPMYRVDDIHAAVERVRAAGGTSTEVEPQPYGLSAECVDDQGSRFYLGQH